MRILFISDNFPPEVNAPASRTYEHCREWVKKGAEVTIITCAPNFPQGEVYKGYKNKLIHREEVEGIKVIRVWSYITSNSGFIRRTLDYVSFAVMAFLVGLFIKTDKIIGTSPQFFAALSAYVLASVKRKRWIMEVRDLWPESIKAVGAMQAGKTFDLLEKLELRLYRNAEKVIVVTDAFKANMVNRGIAKEKIHVVKNGVDTEKYISRGKAASLKKELDLEGKFIVSYLGTHGMAHKLDFILHAAKNLKDNQVHFLLVGDGAEKEKLLQLKEELGLNNVSMLPPVSKEEIVDYIDLSDVALVNLKKSDTFKTVLPSKIFENAAMRKPILIGVDGEARALVEKYGAGLFYEPENEAAFLDATLKLAGDQDTYQKLQEGCETLAKDFNRRILAEAMFNIVEN